MLVQLPPAKIETYGKQQYYITEGLNDRRHRVSQADIEEFVNDFLSDFGKKSDVPDGGDVTKAFRNIGVTGLNSKIHIIRLSDLDRIICYDRLNNETRKGCKIDIEVDKTVSQCIDLFGARTFYFNPGDTPWKGIRTEINQFSRDITDTLSTLFGIVLDSVYIRAANTANPYPLRISAFAGIIVCMSYILGCRNVGLSHKGIPYMRLLRLYQRGWIPIGIYDNTVFVIANI